MRKVIDEINSLRCTAGPGVIREEIWEDEAGKVARYNLTFINHFLTQVDNGRVLGYDNSHGYHHRHFKGAVEPFRFESYEVLLDRFLHEVRVLRKEKS
ncbi:DUF6516 family protein [Granulicella sp. dw_53]|uniref:DUF6516 family protein n=1 Tax=Granulicella sp. dw_53 TaxID=2719792 RepID=UPI001BD58D7F|nr:DUF6516 family protein [Granulicella sp. dw_53]